jgi:predicted lipoprotein
MFRSEFRRSTLACVLGLSCTAFACSEAQSAPEDARRELIKNLGEQVFLPNYRELEARIETLGERAGELCDAPDDERVEAARAAWWEARAPLKENELLAFGPYVEEPGRYGPKLDFWPARVENIEALLAGDGAVDAESVAAFGTAEKGFPVVEYLLYTPNLDVAAAFDDERRCEYLGSLIADLGENAEGLNSAWDPSQGDYLDELVYAGRTSKAFATLDLALGEIVNRLVFTVENARGDKLGGPAGTRTDGTPQPDSAESRFSGRSLEDVRDNLRGVRSVCLGRNQEPADASLAAHLRRIDRGDLAERLEVAFEASFSALDAIPEPLTETVESDAAPVLAAVAELAELQRLLQVDLIHALNLVLTFNDADGD